jgi:hypothetical protein
MKVGLTGGVPVTVVSGQNMPDNIVVDANSIYWATYDGKLMRTAK